MREVKLGSLDIKFIDGDRGKNYPKQEDLLEKGYCLFLSAKNITSDGFQLNDLVFITEEKDNLLRKGKLEDNDIIITTRGTIGNVCIYNNKIPFKNVRINSGMLIIRNESLDINTDYLYQFLKSDIFRERTRTFAFGAAVPQLPISTLVNIKINLPPLETQKKIASILSGYDDLIENNLKRIKILEEMAQQTFVSFTQSENKKVWKSVPLETIIDFHIGGGWGEEEQNEEFSEAGYVIRGTDIDPLKVGNFSKVPFRFHKKSNIKSRELKKGDIVFEVSGGSSNEGVAKTLLITDSLLNVFDERVICASFCKLLRPIDDNDSYYLFYFLNYLREVKLTEIYEKRSASNIVNYNWEAFLKYQKILVPTEKELLAFNNQIIPIKNTVINLGIQNQRLREARDILLPRLMMGMIEV